MKNKGTLTLVLGLVIGASASTAPAANEDAWNSNQQAIPAPVSELESLVGLPLQAQLGRESDEDAAPVHNLFETPEVRAKLLGQTPRFVYIPTASDPLVIPWVREKVVADELLSDAQTMFSRAKATDNKPLAESAYDKAALVIKNYPDSTQATQAVQLKYQIDKFLNEVVGNIGDPPFRDRDFPPFIVRNTTGMILDLEYPEESVVLIDDDVLTVGSYIPRFPTIEIKDAKPNCVVFGFQGNDFTVPLYP